MRRRRWRKRGSRRLKRILITLVSLAIVSAAGAYIMMYVVLRPKEMWREEIYEGVYLSSVNIPERFGEGKAVVAEIHWDHPGVELFFRPFFPRAAMRKHFTLLPADYLVWKHDLSVMMNSTRYVPGEWYKSYPLRQVDSLETLVWDGNLSHIHPNSYMFGWDDEGNFHFDHQKPPRPEFLEKLKWGIGVQSISVMEGQLRMEAMNQVADLDARTFLGVDPIKKIMWFIVYDKIDDLGMNTIARDVGVFVGGKLDSNDASTLIVGQGAKGVLPYTGIRGRRPLGGVMGVRAKSLD